MYNELHRLTGLNSWVSLYITKVHHYYVARCKCIAASLMGCRLQVLPGPAKLIDRLFIAGWHALKMKAAGNG